MCCWNIKLLKKKKCLSRQKPWLRSSRKHKIHQSKPKKQWTNWEKLPHNVAKLRDVRPVTIQDGEVLKPWESGSERPLENLRTNPSTTYARKSLNAVCNKEQKPDGRAKSPSSARSSPRRTLNSMRTTRNGGTMSTTLRENTSVCSWRSITTARQTKSWPAQLLMRYEPKRTKVLQLPCWTKKRRPAESEEEWVFKRLYSSFFAHSNLHATIVKNLSYLSFTFSLLTVKSSK